MTPTKGSRFPEGTLVWIPCDINVWKPAEVLRTTQTHTIVHTEGLEGCLIEERVPHNGTIHIRNTDLYSSEGLQGLDDLTQLTHLHEAAVLHSLNVRFDVDTIYTYTGPILIAANPFKIIPSLYDESKLRYFLENPQPLTGSRVPHVFASAELAYRGMVNNRKRQTILISGESGAGKTESTKFVMRLLALAGSPDWDNRSQIENQVLQSNPLLEAFGNSKTLRNDNSSRFGKFIDMQFRVGMDDQKKKDLGRLVGARIETYLLETVRCCHQLEGERNYHSFYQGCAATQSPGMSKDKKGIYIFPTLLKDKLPDVDPMEIDLSGFSRSHDFKYLTQSTCHVLPRIDDLEEFELTVNAMKDIGISASEINDIYRITGSVLRLGNVEFSEEDREESKVSESSKNKITAIAELLAVDAAELEKAMCNRTLRAGTNVYLKPLNFEQSEDTRDSLARALYNCMFKQIVQKTNMSIGYDETVNLSCGVLDIFGFECFEYNSFEQLCINFTNERLQQFFNTFIFKLEEKLYQAEQIEWSALDFPDNQDCVDLLQKRPWGIMPMLDEECLVPQGSDRAFCNKIKEKHKGSKRFNIIKTKPDWFIINHFAGGVPYCSDAFLEKNKDILSEDIINCIKSSKKHLVANLFEEFLTSTKEAAGTKGRKQKMTVSLEFRNQLQFLMDTVDLTEPHFIRCIKPNSNNMPDLFERKSVCEQLRYGGVLQAVQVSRAGFPVRTVHIEAILDYRMLAEANVRREIDNKLEQGHTRDAAMTLFAHLDNVYDVPRPKHAASSWSVGLTMVFFKHEAYEVFTNEVARIRGKAAEIVQAFWKGRQQRMFYQAIRAYAITIQAHFRGHLDRKRVRHLLDVRAALKIQSLYRMLVARRALREKIRAIIVIQKNARALIARKKVRNMLEVVSSNRLIAVVRAYIQRQTFEAAYAAQLMKREQDEKYQAELAAEMEAERVRLEEERKKKEAEEQIRREEEMREMKEAAKRQEEELNRIREETIAQAAKESEDEMKKLREEIEMFKETQREGTFMLDPKVSSELEQKIAELMEENRKLQEKLEETEKELDESKKQLSQVLSGDMIPSAANAGSSLPQLRFNNKSAPASTGSTGTPHTSKSRPAATGPAANPLIKKLMSTVFGNTNTMNRTSPFPLIPSVAATADMLDENLPPSIYESGEVRPFQEVNDIDSAVTYICFGQEQKHKDYILLAAGGKDGSVVVYRCYRTQSEYKEFCARKGGSNNSGVAYETPLNMFPVHCHMNGHNKAITSIFFTLNEDNLVTTSVDRTVRFWSVESGDMLKVFSDSSPALVALYLPFNPSLFVAANSNSILRVVNIQNGHVLQKLKFESEVRAMKFDDLGMHLVAGTKSGTIHVLEAAEATQLKFRFKIGLSRAAITHITFIPTRQDGETPQIAVNACDSTLSIMDCLYTAHGSMTHLVVKHRLKIPQSLLPLRSCYSGFGSGWLVSASEDRHVYLYCLSKKKEFTPQLLKHHKYPVLTVAVNDTDSLLASADTCGKIVLWRRYDFSKFITN